MASVDRRKTRFTTITAIFLLLTASTAADYASDNRAASFYDVLQSKGLPMGIFPKGISGFSLDPVSGLFELYMLFSSPCDAKFETPVRFQCNITGRLDYGRVSDLSGVAAQELFLWLPVNSITVDIPSSGLIYFDVGVVFKQFSLSFFETPKDCNALAEGGTNDGLVGIAKVDRRDAERFLKPRIDVRELELLEQSRQEVMLLHGVADPGF